MVLVARTARAGARDRPPARFEIQVETPQASSPPTVPLVARMIHAAAAAAPVCTTAPTTTAACAASRRIRAWSTRPPTMPRPYAGRRGRHRRTALRRLDERAARRRRRRGPRGVAVARPAGPPVAGARVLPGLGPARGAAPTRYIATFAFYREGVPAAAARLRDYLGQAETGFLDEPATAKALAAFLLRGLDCGAVDESEVGDRARAAGRLGPARDRPVLELPPLGLLGREGKRRCLTRCATTSTARSCSPSCLCWSVRRRRRRPGSTRSSSGGRGRTSQCPADTDVDAFVGAVGDAGVQLVGLNFAAGDLAGPDLGLVSVPDRSRSSATTSTSPSGSASGWGAGPSTRCTATGWTASRRSSRTRSALRTWRWPPGPRRRIGATVLVEPVSGPKPYPLRTAADG